MVTTITDELRASRESFLQQEANAKTSAEKLDLMIEGLKKLTAIVFDDYEPGKDYKPCMKRTKINDRG
jgi:hypothetical protein|tara:strand:+ start:25084 stop:25287 length:204 start_codon:yes stop_codon:yes gene_type:complete